MDKLKKIVPARKATEDYKCTNCGGDATIAYGSNKKDDKAWDGLVKKGERICLACGRKRGINFF